MPIHIRTLKYTGLLLACLLTTHLKADGGLWRVQQLEKDLIRQMQNAGLRVAPSFIYASSQPSLSHAVVALGGATASLISKNGLILTNYHSVLDALESLDASYPDILEKGFWALAPGQEIPLKGQSVRVLKQSPGQEAEDYDLYTDLRLVGVPPQSVADFGGAAEQGVWPQHKGNFALLRLYTGPDGRPADYHPDNRPLVPVSVLPISARGPAKNEFVMSLGFPLQSRRHQSSFSMKHLLQVTYPVILETRGERLFIMKKWMQRAPSIRALYEREYDREYSNLKQMEAALLSAKRLDVVALREKEEEGLQAWIASQPQWRMQVGELFPRLRRAYAVHADVDRARQYCQETLLSSGLYKVMQGIDSLEAACTQKNIQGLLPGDSLFRAFVQDLQQVYAAMDHRLEQDLFYYSMETFLRNVPRRFWGYYIEELYNQHHGDVFMLISYLWSHSVLASPRAFTNYAASRPHFYLSELLSDPLYQLFNSVTEENYQRQQALSIDAASLAEYDRQYASLLSEMRREKGQASYPEADGSLRLSFGEVGPLQPWNGTFYSSHTSVQGFLDKYVPDTKAYALPADILTALEQTSWSPWTQPPEQHLGLNFLANLDVVQGLGGSPVLNGDGHLLGLVFDGNRPSLLNEAYYHPHDHRAICLDIRFVLWAIQHYAAGYLLGEIGVQ